jgi:hypothetical protein
MRTTDRPLISIIVLACAVAPATAGESPKPVLDFYASEAKTSDSGFSGFSAERGEHLFTTKFSTGTQERPGKPAQARTLSQWRPRRIQSVTPIRRKRKNGLDETATTCSAENVRRRKKVTSLLSCSLNELRPAESYRRRKAAGANLTRVRAP